MKSKFIVTGGAGFIGSNIVKALNQRGITDILVVDQLDSPGKSANLDRIKFLEYFDKDDFRKKVRANQSLTTGTVFHMGACSSTTETNAEYLMDNNFLYTRELCEWCMHHKARFIYASSAATYGDGTLGYSDDDRVTPTLQPLNLYGDSKQMFDTWALEHNLLGHIVGLKFFNVYGPGEDHKEDMRSVINKAYDQILQKGEITLFKSYRSEYKDGEQDRDFVYVQDAVKVSLFFHDYPHRGGLFNCGTGQARTWLDLARAIFAAMGKEPVIRFIEMPEEIREKYQYHTQADISKLRAAGYTQDFTSIEDGTRKYIQTYLSKQKRP